MIINSHFLFLGIIGAYPLGSFCHCENPVNLKSRPNIILILADDVGIDRVGCYGLETFPTPNIDLLAKEGTRFETCYSAPLSGPARSLLITGRYGFRTGSLTNETGVKPSPKNEVSFASVLKKAGYATCQAGKWRHTSETPADWGFDEYITDPTAGGYFWEKSYSKNGVNVNTEKEIYYPDVVHEFSMDFIRRNHDKPFFLYYATHLGHNPYVRTPLSLPDTKDFYSDNIAYLDLMVGKIVAEVKRLKLEDNTLIIFAGDNGTPRENLPTSGRKLIGHKGTLVEGGARVPLIANWKGVTPANHVCNDLIDFSDFFVTFTEVAGGQLPAGIKLDGHSFAPQIMGQKGSPRDWVFVQLGSQWYVREPGWKLNESGELYDMKNAPFEEIRVPDDIRNPEAVAARQRLQSALIELNPAAGFRAQTDYQKQIDKEKKQKH
jgi:arylsulfatase A